MHDIRYVIFKSLCYLLHLCLLFFTDWFNKIISLENSYLFLSSILSSLSIPLKGSNSLVLITFWYLEHVRDLQCTVTGYIKTTNL